MDDQHGDARHRMLIIGAHEGQLRLACESCGAHAIRSSALLFWATRCHVCGEIAEIHGPRERITGSHAADDARAATVSFTRQR
jgi:hypothetical protein